MGGTLARNAGVSRRFFARHLARVSYTKVAEFQARGLIHVHAVLMATTRERTVVNRSYFNARVWKPVPRAAGLPVTRANGTHALRHFYASALLGGGERIRAVSEYLGHADPGSRCGPTPI